MNQEMFWLYELSLSIVCYGMLMGGFFCFLKANFKSTKVNQGLFILFVFSGFLVMRTLSEWGIWSGSLPRLLGYLLFYGLIILAFSGAWEKKLLAAAMLIAVEKLVANFCGSLMIALALVIRHEILKRSDMLESWHDLLITFLTYLVTAGVLCFLSEKSRGLFEEKTGKWYLISAGPLLFMIMVIDAYDWSVSRGAIFWGGENMGIYENQLFSHGAVCILTAVCMFAAGIYVYGMQKIHREWQKKEQYRLQAVYLEGIKNQNEQMDKIRHDMKNHIISLQGLLADGNMEKLKEYLDRIAETGGITGIEEVTGNKAVDALLYEKRKQAEEKSILWQCDMQPWEKCFPDEFDFCVVAGNGLDNAIEACERIKDGTHKFIHIQTGRVKNYFLLEIKNSTCTVHRGKPQNSDSDRKGEEGRIHGIGLLNIKETVEKYNGIMSADIEDGIFVLSVLIPVEQLVPGSEAFK